ILADTEGGNGVYSYGKAAAFPEKTYHADNYWVDVLYTPNTPPVPPGQTPVPVPATETSKTITGLTAGTAYTFTVTAINEGGTGPESAPSSPVTPTAIPPPAPPDELPRARGGGLGARQLDAPRRQRRQRDHRFQGDALPRKRRRDP